MNHHEENKINVTFCEGGFGFGGAVISLMEYLKLADRDINASVITVRNDESYKDFEKYSDRKHISISQGSNKGYLGYFRLLKDVIKYVRIFHRNSIDIVYLNNDPYCNLAACIAAYLTKRKIILHMRGFCLNRFWPRWVAKNLTRAIAISQPIKSNLLELGVPESKVSLVHEGVDFSRFNQEPVAGNLREELGIGKDDVIVSMIGVLVEWKGQHVLISAVGGLVDRFPNIKVLIVGAAVGGSGYEKKLFDMVSHENLGNVVRFLGHRDDVELIMKQSDILVHASTTPEPFGRIVIEGMACGKAVVASDAGGPQELIENNKTGVLVKPGDSAMMAEALQKLIENKEERLAIGRAAAEAAKVYSIQSHADKINWLLHECMTATK